MHVSRERSTQSLRRAYTKRVDVYGTLLGIWHSADVDVSIWANVPTRTAYR